MTVGLRRAASIGLGLVCVVTAFYFVLHAESANRLRDASRQGVARDYQGALDTARRVHGQPESDRALVVQAYALAGLGRQAAAAGALERAAQAAPNDWAIHRDRALVLLRLHRRPEALAEMKRALQLNPRMRLPAAFLPSGG
jgi:Flp pilus assembly protein TadD